MAFATGGVIGVNTNTTYTVDPGTGRYIAGDQPPVALGTFTTGSDGSAWVFCILGTDGITGPGYVCTINTETWEAVMLSTSNDVSANWLGVPSAQASVAGTYIWLQRNGQTQVQVAASAAANVDLVATATAGQLDDGVTVGLFAKGVTLTTARGGTAGLAPAILSWPTVDTLYEPEA